MDRAKTRKPHKKSRNGCLSCKARHVKCDEQQPNCANCVKQGTTCEYRPSRSREASNGSPLTVVTPSFTPSSTEGTVFDQVLAPVTSATAIDVTLNIPQLRLLHHLKWFWIHQDMISTTEDSTDDLLSHYTTVTAKTLATCPEAEEVFTTVLVQTAFDNPYLLHATLALTALHMNHLENTSQVAKIDYWLKAERHHDAALSNFHATVRDIDNANFKAVLLFSNTLFPYSCVASIAASYDLEHAFDSILSNLILTRRIRPMVTGFYDEMKESELGLLIPNDVKTTDWQTAESPVETELVQLRKFSEVVHHVYPPDIVDAYGYAIHILELVFAVAAQSPDPPSDALLKIWIHFVPDRYMELLSERQPGSLVIFAHYAVLLRRSEHYWYLVGVADQILKITDAMVPTEWSKWLDWPKEQIRGGLVSPMLG